MKYRFSEELPRRGELQGSVEAIQGQGWCHLPALCGCKEHYWKADKKRHECKKCGYGRGLKANTVMHGSRLPFRYRFMAIQMLTSTEKGISVKELRQLGRKDCNPAWAMLHKLRDVTDKRDSQYELNGTFGLDEGFFATGIPEGEKGKPLKQGRGGQRKTPVMGSGRNHPENGGNPKRVRKPEVIKHVKMLVVDSFKAMDINSKVKANAKPVSAVISDDSIPCTGFKSIVRKHHARVIPKGQIGKVLPWVYIAISNAKRPLLDIFHDIAPECLQNYLNESCWKFNRR